MIDFSIYRNYDLNVISAIPKSCGIYCFRNNINNKCYIGQAVNIKRRIKGHMAKIADHLLIHKALRKYGIDNFSFYIVEEGLMKEQLNDREIYWVTFFDSYKNGYNMTPGGGQPAEVSEETRIKMQNTSSCKKVIAYNYKYNYYMECKSVQQLARIFKSKNIDISSQNIYDAKRNKSFSKDFIFGETLADIQYILKTKKLPKEINIYLYHIPTKEYSPVFHSSKEATEYIRAFGYTLSDSHVKIALEKNNKYIKKFIIADSVYSLEDRINHYHPYVYYYNTFTGEINTCNNAADAARKTGCSHTDVRKCLLGKSLLVNGYSFGYSKEECIERAVLRLEDMIEHSYNVLSRRHVLDPNYKEWLMTKLKK